MLPLKAARADLSGGGGLRRDNCAARSEQKSPAGAAAIDDEL